MNILKSSLTLIHVDYKHCTMASEEFIELSKHWIRTCSEPFGWTRISFWISPRGPTMTTPWRDTYTRELLTAPSGNPAGSFSIRWVIVSLKSRSVKAWHFFHYVCEVDVQFVHTGKWIGRRSLLWVNGCNQGIQTLKRHLPQIITKVSSTATITVICIDV
jgi:hypothetical protein